MHATLMEAPVTAARISIIAAGGYFYILTTLTATEFPAMAWLTAGAITLPGEFRLTRLVLQCCGAGLRFYDHGTPAAVVGVRC